jgi:hypothetical protein
LDSKIVLLRSQQRDARKKVTLLRHPLKTLGYFVLVLKSHFQWLARFVLHQHRTTSLILISIAILYTIGLNVSSPIQEKLESSWGGISIGAWWVMLGFLSSFGLGTGLHTFVLYLGPFIASATLAATECSRTDFAKYGANRFQCAEKGTVSPSFFDLWQLIALEAFLWGAGTAIGELPPYFVARAARLAGERLKEAKVSRRSTGSPSPSNGADESDSDQEESEDDDMQQINEIHSGITSPVEGVSPIGSPSPSSSSSSSSSGNNVNRPPRRRKVGLFDRAKRWVIGWLGHIGFLGILLFASIPNPLFDLAGLTCGHMLVPFVTFFSATLIGKAVVKVNLQTFFIITVFNKDILEALVRFIDTNIPFASGRARSMFDNMRKQYHRPPGTETLPDASTNADSSSSGGKGIFALWDLFLGLMIAYFLMSIINSSVQEYLVNRDEELVEKFRLEHEKTK